MDLVRRLRGTLARSFGVGSRYRGPSDRVFYIQAPDYSPWSSGVRCLFLLCHHLNRLGYRAYVSAKVTAPGLSAPSIGLRKIEANRRRDVDDIVVYPEVVAGNPLVGRNVVRYLLNRPGLFTGVGMEGFGPDDFFVHFAEEFRPEGFRSFALPLPVVDRSMYRETSPPRRREGFLLYSHRQKPDFSALPGWLSPHVLVTMKARRPPTELAELYRGARALVTWERTAAIGEAIQCGCPVIVAPNSFPYQPIIDRYRGNGLAVGWDEHALDHAQRTIAIAKRSYWRRFRRLDTSIHMFVRLANEHFDARAR